ncbi:MAG: NUDIX domain-containing protein [Candidatus Saccharibacteria bacterium]|nr:NUDIX domain-containing protein [Candidatus Saccharibacteria bacterium]
MPLIFLSFYTNKNKSWGLPSGHIEAGETPDQAIERELMEECGLAIPHLQCRDFFLHSKGKIILAYAGVTPSHTLQSTKHNCEGAPT